MSAQDGAAGPTTGAARTTGASAGADRAAAAPQRNPLRGPAGAEPNDTLLGRVTEAGADPATWIALRPAGGRGVRLEGNTAGLRSVTGAEVWVSGRQSSDRFFVRSFEVRAVDGAAVSDGTVIVAGDRVSVRTRTGVHPIPNAPPTMAELHGARIWVTRPVATRSPTYGVIIPAPR